jgi:hypothetical protein
MKTARIVKAKESLEGARGFTNDENALVYPWIGEGLCPAEIYYHQYN